MKLFSFSLAPMQFSIWVIRFKCLLSAKEENIKWKPKHLHLFIFFLILHTNVRYNNFNAINLDERNQNLQRTHLLFLNLFTHHKRRKDHKLIVHLTRKYGKHIGRLKTTDLGRCAYEDADQKYFLKIWDFYFSFSYDA